MHKLDVIVGAAAGALSCYFNKDAEPVRQLVIAAGTAGATALTSEWTFDAAMVLTKQGINNFMDALGGTSIGQANAIKWTLLSYAFAAGVGTGAHIGLTNYTAPASPQPVTANAVSSTVTVLAVPAASAP